MRFDSSSIVCEEIRIGNSQLGTRVTVRAHLGQARISLQIDIAAGDAIHPEPITIEYPVLLGDPAPVLRACPRETVIAEKFEAIVDLGLANSRLKDYYDLDMLVRESAFDRQELEITLEIVFVRRQTSLPDTLPVGLSEDYVMAHTDNWNSFLDTVDATERRELRQVIRDLEAFFQFLWLPS